MQALLGPLGGEFVRIYHVILLLFSLEKVVLRNLKSEEGQTLIETKRLKISPHF